MTGDLLVRIEGLMEEEAEAVEQRDVERLARLHMDGTALLAALPPLTPADVPVVRRIEQARSRNQGAVEDALEALGRRLADLANAGAPHRLRRPVGARRLRLLRGNGLMSSRLRHRQQQHERASVPATGSTSRACRRASTRTRSSRS